MSGGLHYRRNPSRAFQLAVPLPACSMLEWTVVSVPLSHQGSAQPQLLVGLGRELGRVSVGRGWGLKELGQGLGSGLQLSFPASCPPLTGAPSLPR